MKHIINILEQLRATSGKLDKLAILKANENNLDLRNFLFLTYGVAEHNFYQTTIDKNIGVAEPAVLRELTTENLNLLAGLLSSRQITGNAAKIKLAQFWVAHDEAGREVIQCMIERDAKAGIGEGSILKTWADLIHVVPYMRCALPKHAKFADWDWAKGALSQLKCDGMYANVNVYATPDENGRRVTVTSRNGSKYPISEFGPIVSELQKIDITEDTQFQGEMLVFQDGVILPRDESNGKMNSILAGEALDPGQEIRYVVWDVIPLAEAKAKAKYLVPVSERFAQVKKLLPEGDISNFISAVETKIVHSLAEALEHYKELLARGEEGTVLKEPHAPWIDGTSNFQIKFKLEAEIELRVVGFNAASKGKNVDTFASVQLASEDGSLETGCTGLKDDVRLDMHRRREQMVGNSIFTVRCNGIMFAKKEGDKHSVFLPRFVVERRDKTVANTFDEIKDIFENLIRPKK